MIMSTLVNAKHFKTIALGPKQTLFFLICREGCLAQGISYEIGNLLQFNIQIQMRPVQSKGHYHSTSV